MAALARGTQVAGGPGMTAGALLGVIHWMMSRKRCDTS